MSLTVLSVAYPTAVAGPDAVGGAEQVLVQIDRALVEAGHRSIVIAAEGSRVAGQLVPVRCGETHLDTAVPAARELYRRAIVESLAQFPVDVVHFHGIDFCHYLPPPGVPVLATLHGPREWYPDEARFPRRPDTWIHCVSQRQADSMGQSPAMLAPIENGVEIPDRPPPHAKRNFALILSRIAPEKGIQLGMDAAKLAGVPLLIAGRVYDYADHVRYFDEEIAPRLDGQRRFIGPAGLARKRRLLAAARCLLVPSACAETSSLAAREAIAMGTPAIAFRNGALIDTIDHGRTGFLVYDYAEMAGAIGKVAAIDPDECRAVARTRFSLEAMIGHYFQVYRSLAQARQRRPAFGARA